MDIKEMHEKLRKALETKDKDLLEDVYYVLIERKDAALLILVNEDSAAETVKEQVDNTDLEINISVLDELITISMSIPLKIVLLEKGKDYPFEFLYKKLDLDGGYLESYEYDKGILRVEDGFLVRYRDYYKSVDLIDFKYDIIEKSKKDNEGDQLLIYKEDLLDINERNMNYLYNALNYITVGNNEKNNQRMKKNKAY